MINRIADLKKLIPLLWIFIVVLYLGLVKQNWTPSWSGAIYIESARSMVTGQGNTYLGYPQLKYPIGFPLLLSPIVWLWGNNFLLMSLFIVLCALGSIFVTYWLFTQFFSREYSILITALTAFSYLMVERSTYIMSGVPYMMCSLLALVYINRYLRFEKKYKYGILAGLLIIISAFLRTVGISIFFGLLLHLFLVKNVRFRAKKAVLILLLVIIPLTAWNVRNQTVEVDLQDPIWQLEEFIPYQQEFMRSEWDEPLSEQINPRIMFFRVVKNISYFGGQAAGLILGRRIDIVMGQLHSVPISFLLLLGVIALVIVAGFGLSFFSRKYIFDCYVLCYFGILFLTSAREPRYLVPVLPFIIYYFITGIEWLFKRVSPLTIRSYHVPMSIFFIIYFIGSNIFTDVKIVMSQHKTPFYSEEVQNYRDAIFWLKDNTSKESKIIGIRPPNVVLLSGRWCVSFPWVKDQYMILDFINRVEAEYIFVSPATLNKQRFMLPVLTDNPNLFQLLYSKGEAKVYQVKRNLLSDKLDEMRKLKKY